MNLGKLNAFNEVWTLDFEFAAPDGNRPVPHCMVAREVKSGRLVRLWQDDMASHGPPFDPGREDVVFVAFYSSAEIGCFKALGWPQPKRMLDLYAEFNCLTSGLARPHGKGLIGALMYHGLAVVDAEDKQSMRDLALRGGPYTAVERDALLDYCQSDVDALDRLLPVMSPKIDLPRALLRGRYMCAAAEMEWVGVPIDTGILQRLRDHWEDIRDQLVSRIDADYGVYEGNNTFKANRFAAYLIREQIPWPTLDSGRLAMDDDTFKTMAKSYPRLNDLRELRLAMSQMRLSKLTVGDDGRNRCLLSAFGSKTGRNQPSNSKFIFGPSVWLRGLIHPEPGTAVAYVDYSQQEFGIAAALSGDVNMMEAYRSGDPYLAFAKQAGAAPAEATKETHREVRDRFKCCVLGVQYGMGAESLARSLGQPGVVARDLLRRHRETYPTFWAWSQAAIDHGMLHGRLQTVFGWSVHCNPQSNGRSLGNFPMQANGAEILRLACCLTTEAGIKVCAPVHDALLIEAPIDDIDEAVAETQRHMIEAGRVVLDGFELRTDVDVVKYPDRYSDPRGGKMWATVMRLLDGLAAGNNKAAERGVDV